MKIGKADVRVLKKLTSNALLVRKPELIQVVNGEAVRSERIIAKSHWELQRWGIDVDPSETFKIAKNAVAPYKDKVCFIKSRAIDAAKTLANES